MNNSRVILIVLDGFGASGIEEGNAVLAAKTPFLDYCWANFPKTLLRASGQEVGLPWGEMGNSEVGHINLGTGRVPLQDLTRINNSIDNGSFFKMQYLVEACQFAKKNNSTLHLLGLLSNGGIHTDIKHLLALVDLAKNQGIKKLAIHIFTDGRDMPKQSAEGLFKNLDEKIKQTKIGSIATMIGRFYAMDRDNNWDRIEKAYNLIVRGIGEKYADYSEALKERYKKGDDDEILFPVVLDEKNTISNNDSVIFFNFRSDRAKQLAETLINPNFKKFARQGFPKNLHFVSFVSYGNEQTPLVDVAYVSTGIVDPLAKIVSDERLTQLHIAETEKYAHVTYFFNGGIEKAMNKEERILVPSPKVKSYDLKPQMSALEVTEKCIKYYKSANPDFTLINFANPDMVGHTGNYRAAIQAIETVDRCSAQIVKNFLDESTSVIITSDHGNAEQMINPETKEIDKQHTTNAVPYVYLAPASSFDSNLSNNFSLSEKIAFFSSEPAGILADIAPTIMNLLNLKSSKKMTGTNLKNII